MVMAEDVERVEKLLEKKIEKEFSMYQDIDDITEDSARELMTYLNLQRLLLWMDRE
jgi:hypothetical protein